MTDLKGGTDLRFSPANNASNKKTTPNVSGGWIVMVLSGLIAVVIFLFVTAQGGQKFQVLVAAHDIAPGQVVHNSDFNVASVNLDQAQLSRLIASKDESTYNGYIATGPISTGDPVTKSMLLPAATSNGNIAMSIPVDKAHAVNGNLKVGDTVALIDENNGNIAVTGLQVISVDSTGGNALAGSGTFTLTVSATQDQVTKIGALLKDNKFDVVNATGNTPPAASSGVSNSSTTSTTAP